MNDKFTTMRLHINSWLEALGMKTITLCLMIISLLAATNLVANQPDTENPRAQRIMVLGDSLSAAYNIPLESGWVSLLASELSPTYTLINASVSGETTGGGLSRLPALLEDHKPDWVLVELGGNDGLRGFPLKLIRENLLKMGELIVDSGASPIYLGIEIPPNYGPRYTESFAKIFPEVAEIYSAAYLNLFIEDFYQSEGLLQDDGIHPTESAQPLIKDHVKEFLTDLLN